MSATSCTKQVFLLLIVENQDNEFPVRSREYDRLLFYHFSDTHHSDGDPTPYVEPIKAALALARACVRRPPGTLVEVRALDGFDPGPVPELPRVTLQELCDTVKPDKSFLSAYNGLRCFEDGEPDGAPLS